MVLKLRLKNLYKPIIFEFQKFRNILWKELIGLSFARIYHIMYYYFFIVVITLVCNILRVIFYNRVTEMNLCLSLRFHRLAIRNSDVGRYEQCVNILEYRQTYTL